MSRLRTDEHAIQAIRSAILGLPGLPGIDRVDVLAGEDHDGEPTLSTTIHLKAGQGRMTGSQLLDAIVAATQALQEIDDPRVPFVTFLQAESERESAEDTRPAA